MLALKVNGEGSVVQYEHHSWRYWAEFQGPEKLFFNQLLTVNKMVPHDTHTHLPIKVCLVVLQPNAIKRDGPVWTKQISFFWCLSVTSD